MTLDRRTALTTLAGAAAAAWSPLRLAGSETREAPPDSVGVLIDTTRCVGCRACMAACRRAAGLEADDRTPGHELWDAPTTLNDRTPTLVKYASSTRGDAFVKVQCMHCVDPACASACMLGALSKGPDGAVTWDGDYCVGCRYCQVACPFGVPAFEWSSATPRIVKCDLCAERRAEGKAPACCEACPRDALTFGRRAELLEEAHQRICRDPDRYVPYVYGERDMGGTQVLYLAEVPFDELGLPVNGTRPTHALQRALQHRIYQGFVAPVALYGVLGAVLFRNTRMGNGEGEDADGA